MKYRVVGDRVLVRLPKATEMPKSEGGIILAPQAPIDRTEGEIVAFGSGPHVQKGEYSVGDRILFRKMAGVTVKIDGEDLIIMDADEVYLKFDG